MRKINRSFLMLKHIGCYLRKHKIILKNEAKKSLSEIGKAFVIFGLISELQQQYQQQQNQQQLNQQQQYQQLLQ